MFKRVVLICVFLGTIISCTSQQKDSSIVNISVTELQQILATKKVQLIDVRTSFEFTQGHIKNAMFINFLEEGFIQQVEEKLNKKEPVYIYCRTGNRSAYAAKDLYKKGFNKVYNVLGGITSWKNKNFEIVK